MNAYQSAKARGDTRGQHYAAIALRNEMTLRLAKETGFGRARLKKLKGRIGA